MTDQYYPLPDYYEQKLFNLRRYFIIEDREKTGYISKDSFKSVLNMFIPYEKVVNRILTSFKKENDVYYEGIHKILLKYFAT